MHSIGHHLIDGIHMTIESRAYLGFELLRITRHQMNSVLKFNSCGIISSLPWIVETGLITAQIDVNISFNQSFPQVDNISNVTNRCGLTRRCTTHHSINGIIDILSDLIKPSLLMAFVCGDRVDFCDDARCPCNYGCFGLGTGHATEATGHVGHPS